VIQHVSLEQAWTKKIKNTRGKYNRFNIDLVRLPVEQGLVDMPNLVQSSKGVLKGMA